MTKSYAALCALALAFATSSYAAPPPKNVDVINSPLPVRDVDNAARSPIQFMLCNFFGQNACSSAERTEFNVPSDRRLVIEFVSGTCRVGLGPDSLLALDVGIWTTAGGGGAFHTFNLVTSPITQVFRLGASQQTRIYADAGSTVTLTILGTSSGPDAEVTCRLVFSGFTVAP